MDVFHGKTVAAKFVLRNVLPCHTRIWMRTMVLKGVHWLNVA
jgi:hypothetical protein